MNHADTLLLAVILMALIFAVAIGLIFTNAYLERIAKALESKVPK